MNFNQPEDIRTLLHQTRSLLAVTVLMAALSHAIDPPYTTIGTLFDILVLVVLVFVLYRIHRSLKALESSMKIL